MSWQKFSTDICQKGSSPKVKSFLNDPLPTIATNLAAAGIYYRCYVVDKNRELQQFCKRVLKVDHFFLLLSKRLLQMVESIEDKLMQSVPYPYNIVEGLTSV